MKQINIFAIGVLSILVSMAVVGCNGKMHTDVAEVEWLLGRWEGVTEEGTAIEEWTKESDEKMLGTGVFIIGDDTVFSEALAIIVGYNTLIYEADPSGQTIVQFPLAASKKNEIVFENLEHDFPQRITYRKLAGDSLMAVIEGMVNEEFKSTEFRWKKVK